MMSGNKKTILLTGGLGYIGSHTAVELLNKGYQVVVYDNLSNSDLSTYKAIKDITGKSFRLDVGDILNVDNLNETFKATKPDAVIHFAGLKAVGESVSQPLMYYDNNIVGTINLLNVMAENSVDTLVFSSSATVYGDPEKLPLTEESPLLKTTNPYGESKAMIERILQDCCNAYNNFTVVCLRYFNPVGAHESGLIGENPKGMPNNIMPFIAQVENGIREHLSIFGNDYDTVDGTGVRDYLHVVDLALGHVAAIEKVKSPGKHIYNLGTGRGTSVLELVSAYSKTCGKEIPYKIVERRAGDIASCYANCDKAKNELGWVAKLNIEDMCRSTQNFARKLNS